MEIQNKTASFRLVNAPAISFSKETTALQVNAWKAWCAKRSGLYSAGLMRVIRVVEQPMHSTIEVVKDVEYSDLVGLRNIDNFLNVVPQEDYFQVLSAIALVETADGHRVLLERDSGDWERSLELSGGFVRAEETNDSLNEFIHTRVAADFALSRDTVASVEFIQTVDFREIAEVMAVFRVRLRLSFDELLQETSATIYRVPKEYTVDTHRQFFELPLHIPSSVILKEIAGL